MKKGRIIVIGSYLVALVMDTDRIPLKGETLLARNFRQTHGGKGSNQAVQAARMGAETLFIGFVGNDSFGKSFLDLCNEENIDSSSVVLSDKYPTGAGLIICAEDGSNIITIDIGANNQLVPEEIDRLTTGIVPGDYILVQMEIPASSALYACRRAKELGATVILNPAPASFIGDRDMSFIDFITPNETEARVCVGIDPSTQSTDWEAATGLKSLGCKNVIITLGEKGCLLVNDHICKEIPAFSFPKIVDTTGAGDSFNAALAVGLSEGMSLQDACRLANAAAGLACTLPNTIPSYKHRPEIDMIFNK